MLAKPNRVFRDIRHHIIPPKISVRAVLYVPIKAALFLFEGLIPAVSRQRSAHNTSYKSRLRPPLSVKSALYGKHLESSGAGFFQQRKIADGIGKFKTAIARLFDASDISRPPQL